MSRAFLTAKRQLKIRRNRQGEESSQIELAIKILTCKGQGLKTSSLKLEDLVANPFAERIRSTLSHEMCHLVSWTMDKQLMRATARSSRNGENRSICHVFRSVLISNRGSRVMKAHPDVEIAAGILYNICQGVVTDPTERRDIPMKYRTNMNGVRTSPPFQ